MSQMNLTIRRGNPLTNPLRFTFSALNNHHYPLLKDRILSAERVQRLLIKEASAAHAAAMLEEGTAGEKVTFSPKEAHKILDGMMAATSRGMLRFAGWFLHIFLSRIFPRGVYVSGANLDRIQELSKKGSVLFLPTHKSYFDFILVTFACYANHIQAPYIAAGDNFKIPFIGWLAHKHGAFFIKRRLEGANQLYKTLLAEYVTQILATGCNLEVFIEGARSRSGRIMYPKFGLLSRVVEAALDGKAGEIYVVPVGISFEKLLDTGFPRELLGVPKVNESLWGVISSFFKSLFRQFGATHVHFAEPFSITEFVELYSQESKEVEAGELLERQSLIRDLGVYAIKQAQRTSMLTDSCILSFLMLTKFRKGVSRAELVEAFDWLKKEIKARDFDVCSGEHDPATPLEQVNATVGLLSHLLVISPQDGSVKPSQSLEALIELLFYSNQILHVFWGEALVYTATLSMLEGMQPETINQAVFLSRDAVQTRFGELLEIVNKENVVLGPFDDEGLFFKKSLWELSKLGLVTERDNEIGIRLGEERQISNAKMLLGLLRPILDACYYIYEEVATLGNTSLQEKELLDRTQQRLISLWKRGLLEHGEACSLDLLKRGWEAFQRIERVSKAPVLSRPPSESSGTPTITRESSFLLGSMSALNLSIGLGSEQRTNVVAKFRIDL